MLQALLNSQIMSPQWDSPFTPHPPKIYALLLWNLAHPLHLFITYTLVYWVPTPHFSHLRILPPLIGSMLHSPFQSDSIMCNPFLSHLSPHIFCHYLHPSLPQPDPIWLTFLTWIHQPLASYCPTPIPHLFLQAISPLFFQLKWRVPTQSIYCSFPSEMVSEFLRYLYFAPESGICFYLCIFHLFPWFCR